MAARQWMGGAAVTLPPYMLRREQHKIGKAGRKSEVRLIRELGGRGRPASGALEGSKGDISFPEVLLEAKSTTQDSMSVKFAWLAKIGKEARSEGKMPALAISFVNEQGQAHMDGDWVLVPAYKFRELV